MKELSIEEKAKAYDEALKVLHKYDGANIMFSQSLKEEMFPELKESEDERIRRAIIDDIQCMHREYSLFKDFSKEAILSWLEKQGEQSKKHDVCDNCDQQGSCVSPCPMKLVEKQGEQKSYGQRQECVDCQFNYAGECKGSCAMKRGEQKPAEDRYMEGYLRGINDTLKTQKPAAWSEEDENLFRCAIDAVKQESKVRTDGCLDEEVGGMVIDWLNSLKDRVQSKQEWSKEDEAFYQRLEQIVCKVDIEAFQGDRDLHSWLKSLRPQNRWKPSDEQMKCLDNVKGSDDHNGYILNTLYNELKKLKD